MVEPAATLEVPATLVPFHEMWGGLNLRTAENVQFASSEQLMHDYNNCVFNFKVPSGVVLAWFTKPYEGEIAEDGMPDGHGCCEMAGGLKYTGSFKRGLLHGQGVLHFGDGNSYDGLFFWNCLQGRGTYHWRGSAVYVGKVFDGFPDDEGSLHTGKDGNCCYQGTWTKGLRQGQGKLTYGNEGDSIYTGGWENDRRHGEGHLAYPSGSSYRGGWSEGKKHGRGHMSLVISTASGGYNHRHWRIDATVVQIYDGDWKDDMPHGRGTTIWADDGKEEDKNILRNKYIGEFNEGALHGNGTYLYASGAIFKGQWKLNRKNGPGKLIYEDGKIYGGLFVDDQFKATLPDLQIMEPLDGVLGDEGDVVALKRKINDLILRNISSLKEIFTTYSYVLTNSSWESRQFQERPRAMLLEQLWQLCHDGRIVAPGFGLARIDHLLCSTEDSWDHILEMHSDKRHIIFREFCEYLVKLAKFKITTQEDLDIKVDKLIQFHILPLLKCELKDTTYNHLEAYHVKKVLDDYKEPLKTLFNETLIGIGTSDGTIKIGPLLRFFAVYKDNFILQQEALFARLLSALYYSEVKDLDDANQLLDFDLNYKELQLSLLVIADVKQDDADPSEDALASLIKDVIVPNLATNLELLFHGPMSARSSSTGTPRSQRKGDKASPNTSKPKKK